MTETFSGITLFCRIPFLNNGLRLSGQLCKSNIFAHALTLSRLTVYPFYPFTSWSSEPNPEDQINRTPDDQINK